MMRYQKLQINLFIKNQHEKKNNSLLFLKFIFTRQLFFRHSIRIFLSKKFVEKTGCDTTPHITYVINTRVSKSLFCLYFADEYWLVERITLVRNYRLVYAKCFSNSKFKVKIFLLFF